jgi:hypothetical protein
MFDIFRWIRRCNEQGLTTGALALCMALIPLIDNASGELQTATLKELARRLDMPRRSLSRHLSELKACGLLTSKPLTARVADVAHSKVESVSKSAKDKQRTKSISWFEPNLAHSLNNEPELAHSKSNEPILAHSKSNEPELAHSAPSHEPELAHSQNQSVPILAPPTPPIKELPLKTTPLPNVRVCEAEAPVDEAAAGEVVCEDIQTRLRQATHSLPTNARLKTKRRPQDNPLTAAALLAIWQEVTGVEFGQWRRGSSWQNLAPIWAGVARHYCTESEWRDLACDAAGKGLEDRAGLPWLTKALSNLMRANALKAPVPPPPPVELTLEDTQAGGAALTSILRLVSEGAA